jgi:hypothetical protein
LPLLPVKSRHLGCDYGKANAFSISEPILKTTLFQFFDPALFLS